MRFYLINLSKVKFNRFRKGSTLSELLITLVLIGVVFTIAIGVMVANAANHLGMTVYGYDPYLSVKSAWNLNHNAVYINDINE